MGVVERAEVPVEWVERVDRVLSVLPGCRQEDAWTGVRWRVGQATVAHIFGGEDQLLRIVFRAEADEVAAFEHMGHPYFRAGWGRNVVGLVLDDVTDQDELTELLTVSYVVQAPARLSRGVELPP